MMKKITLLLLLIPIFSIAQVEVDHFEITPDGVNGYVVKEYPEKTSAELFKAAKRWAEYTINKAEEAKKSEIENEYLNYSIRYNSALTAQNFPIELKWDLILNIEFRFKDGKIRHDVNIIEISDALGTNFYYKGGMLQWSFYKNNGKPKGNTEQARLEFNAITNNIIEEVSKYVSGEAKSNDGW